MDKDLESIVAWARSQGWTVRPDSKGYTRFYAPDGDYVVRYPATPSNPRQRMHEVKNKLRARGLQIPPPSKKEQRARRRMEEDR